MALAPFADAFSFRTLGPVWGRAGLGKQRGLAAAGTGNYLAGRAGGRVVAVPSRIFVGITMFGLISTLVVVPFTVLVVTCDPASTGSIFGGFAGNDCTVFGAGQKVFLALASILTVSFTVLSWRALLAGARRDAIRRRRAKQAQSQGPGPGQVRQDRPDAEPGLAPKRP